MENEKREGDKPSKPVQDYKVYIMALEGYTFRYLKSLAAYDIEMPVLMRDKISDANVRSDVVLTPAVLKYIISRLEVINVNNLPRMHTNSIRKALLYLYNIK